MNAPLNRSVRWLSLGVLLGASVAAACGVVWAATALATPTQFGFSARAAYVTARSIDYAGTALFIGGCVFVAFLWPAGSRVRAVRMLLLTGWSLGLVGTLAAIGFEGTWATQRSPVDAWHWDTVRVVLGMDFGREWAAKALLWVLAGVVLTDLWHRYENAATSLAWRVGAGAVGLGVLRVIGMTGHASDVRHRAVAATADLVHLAGMAVWIGGLSTLVIGVLPRGRTDELITLVPRYSTLALGSVLAVIVAGTVMAWQLVGGVSALFHTGYGQLLLVKIGLLLVILSIAAICRIWIARRLNTSTTLRAGVATVRPFVYLVAVETALLLLVLVAASALVTANPGQ